MLLAVQITPVTTAVAHEAWLQPVDYNLPLGSSAKLDVMAGQNFSGHRLSFNPVRFSRIQHDSGLGARDIEGRLGDLPALQFMPPNEGLYSVVYQSTGSEIEYDGAEKFRLFAEKEGVEWVLQAHQKRGLNPSGFSERFFRYCKALVGVGHSMGDDRYMGMPFELVALQNPMTDESRELTLQLLWMGKAVPALLSVYEKTLESDAILRTYTIDLNGQITIQLRDDSVYLLNAVRMEAIKSDEFGEPDAPVWRSHWASMTFTTEGN